MTQRVCVTPPLRPDGALLLLNPPADGKRSGEVTAKKPASLELMKDGEPKCATPSVRLQAAVAEGASCNCLSLEVRVHYDKLSSPIKRV